MNYLIDILLHLDHHLAELTATYGTAMYAALFLVVFCETGLVVMPFLPGDSLLFAAGAIAALGGLNIWVLLGLLLVAAIVGDTVNYHIGKYLGPQVLCRDTSRWLNPKHLERTHQYFERYGARTIMLARFVPLLRTLAPFVAGVGTMDYRRFLFYNVLGGTIWVVGFLMAGYWFGNIPIVKQNFTLVILAIVGVSGLPIVLEFYRGLRHRWTAGRAAKAAASDTLNHTADRVAGPMVSQEAQNSR